MGQSPRADNLEITRWERDIDLFGKTLVETMVDHGCESGDRAGNVREGLTDYGDDLFDLLKSEALLNVRNR